MTKWADFVITAVESRDYNNIKYVKVHTDLGETLGTAEWWSKSKVVRLIDAREFSFVTAYKRDGRTWERGDDVHLVTVKEKKFIRTDGNSIAEDNLGNLPEV